MDSYIIREFKLEDLDDVVRINKTCLPENYPAYFFIHHHNKFPKSFLVAESNGKIVGYVMCRVEYGLLHTKKSIGRKGHIISIAVLPQNRRRGIGKALMKKALEALKKIYVVDEYYLEVRVTNTIAINLYQKLGFSIVNRLRRYYLDGEDAFLMAMEA